LGSELGTFHRFSRNLIGCNSPRVLLHTVHSVKGGCAYKQVGYLIFKTFRLETPQWIIGVLLRPNLDSINRQYSRGQPM
jgi:hypothetical protein